MDLQDDGNYTFSSRANLFHNPTSLRALNSAARSCIGVYMLKKTNCNCSLATRVAARVVASLKRGKALAKHAFHGALRAACNGAVRRAIRNALAHAGSSRRLVSGFIATASNTEAARFSGAKLPAGLRPKSAKLAPSLALVDTDKQGRRARLRRERRRSPRTVSATKGRENSWCGPG